MTDHRKPARAPALSLSGPEPDPVSLRPPSDAVPPADSDDFEAMSLHQRTIALLEQSVLTRRAVTLLADATQRNAVAAEHQSDRTAKVEARLSGVESLASQGLSVASRGLECSVANGEKLDRVEQTSAAHSAMMGQVLAAIGTLNSTDRSHEERMSSTHDLAEQHGAQLAQVGPQVEALAPKVEAHDRLFKPTVLVRNTLLFAGGIVAYLIHLVLGHFDSLAKVRAFFGGHP